MRRAKSDSAFGRRLKLPYFLLAIAALYLFFIAFKFPQLLEIASVFSGDDSFVGLDGSAVGEEDGDISKPFFSSFYKDTSNRKLEDNEYLNAPLMPHKEPFRNETGKAPSVKPRQLNYSRIIGAVWRQRNKTMDQSLLERMADEAWTLGQKAWAEVGKMDTKEVNPGSVPEGKPELCPSSISVSGEELERGDNVMFLPCGLAAGSSITVVGTPHAAHQEIIPQLARLRRRNSMVWVSQFVVELQGLKAVDGEDPPKILHLNPRLKGDWSLWPVIEHNTCYRMHWGVPQRCNGLSLGNNDDMLVDGFGRCERWMRNDIADTKESKTSSWFKRFIGRRQRPEVTWSFPFAEGSIFILTIRAGVGGFQINVGGHHVSSFPYRMGFTLEDATGLAIKGDVDVHSVYATSLPKSHPSFSLQQFLEMSEKWKAHPLPESHLQLFIGILSASNHFAERMAVRKTWMQSSEIKSSNIVARFFVALHPRKEVNALLKKEASYFGDIVILPFMDRYELVVLKTIAICEYGVKNLTAAYIMKCDDDTFIRVDAVLNEIKAISPKKSLYMGNLNLFHRPLRKGKWGVTFKEWPEDLYPPYANGPGYIISSDIARFIVSQHANQSLRLFKMEDVSMGLWVGQFNSTRTVQYSHNWKFCQYGCLRNYYTAHYQSPIQMICLWDKLSRGRANCCNYR
ncbi:hydroxyproline O-galactosyltransferase GALT2-like [Telopea speciosissima]|uniref:hydroxyproline O-galactosyltransferase GALT2-like n=1 Tax=Telopea speciosissima TaxID=54955 RepID=UPI001CC7691E|nr:hydroxyproline O-galactosyltransferase GALT2-like [Telopea speciosissima]XP_043700778.1 hydroxyproline O-galactosyltransferase GALT2-like [Telopea speciosissima]